MEYEDEYEYDMGSEGYGMSESLPDENEAQKSPFNFFAYDSVFFCSEDQVKKDMEGMMKEFVEGFGLSEGLAFSILLKSKLNMKKAELALQDDISMIPTLAKLDSLYIKASDCPICLDEYQNGSEIYGSNCEHKCCKTCFRGYIEMEIQLNHQLPFKCIQEGCNEFISLETVQSFLSNHLKPKLSKNLLNSIVLNSEKLKFCPGANCDLIIKFNELLKTNKPINIRCNCNTCFCSLCNRDAHLPLSCELYAEWESLNKSGNDIYSDTWIKLRTKKCPQCQTPIEKNKGCMHMTCRTCSHDFCWLCMKDWSKHGSETGGFYRCNMYNPDDEDVKSKSKMASDLERFKFLSERFIQHRNSVEHSQKKKFKMMNEYNEIIKELQLPNDDYLLHSMNLIIDCRRAIAYSYGVAHFLKEPAKLQFFQFLQNQAESFLENLDHDTDKEIKDFVNKEVSNSFLDEYYIWSNNIKIKTQTLKSYFNEIFFELENGLPSVKGGLSLEKSDSLYKVKEDPTNWICPICTLANDLTVDRCDACENQRPENIV